MAKAKKQATTVLKWKKKKFYPIISPMYLGEKVVGETPVFDPSLLVGRKATVNLMSITGQPSKKDISVTFEVTGIQDAKAQTNLVRYEIMPTSIKRMVRRDRTKVDTSFVVVTNDDIPVRVKPFLLTTTKADKSVKKALILESQRFLASYFSKKKYSEIVPALLQDTMQRELGGKLKKIHPLRMCTIRSFSIEKIKAGKTQVKKAAVEEEPEEVVEETVEEEAETQETDSKDTNEEVEEVKEVEEEEEEEEQSEESEQKEEDALPED